MIDIQDTFINRKANLRLYDQLMAFQHVPCHSKIFIHDSFSLNVTFSASNASWSWYLSFYLSTHVSFLSIFLSKVEWSKCRLKKGWCTLFLIKKMLLYLNMYKVTSWYITDARKDKKINNRIRQTNNIEENIDMCECMGVSVRHVWMNLCQWYILHYSAYQCFSLFRNLNDR
jgi:hypothetical protein